MPSGVYQRTQRHREINSKAHKEYFKKNPEARRRISISVMKANYLKKFEEKEG